MIITLHDTYWLDKISTNTLRQIIQYPCYSSIISLQEFHSLRSGNFAINLNIIIETVGDPKTLL